MGASANRQATLTLDSQNPGSPSAALAGANILVVDDQPQNLLAMAAVLEPLGENLHTARSGVDALRLLLRHDFAVILMDAHMPEMSGFETASLIRSREKCRNVPILFVTAYGRDESLLNESYAVGAVDYIAKPFEPNILRSKVRVFVELYKKNEQLRQQAELLHQGELAEAERRKQELAEAMEREHMRNLNHELEAKVRERTRELVAANEELEKFCYSVSHDLRSPLRAISAASMILLQESGDKLGAEERQKLHHQAAAAKRLGKLIDDLLTLARLSRVDFHRESIDLSQVATEVAGHIPINGRSDRHQLVVEPGLTCLGAPTLVSVLLQNLLENAFKYSPQGGQITVGTADGAFYVRDEGIGMDMNYAHKIFLPFERLVLESEYPGTGIGLATAERIVTRHGGKIWVESQLGKGSTLYFTLDQPMEKPSSGLNGSTKTMQRSESVS